MNHPFTSYIDILTDRCPPQTPGASTLETLPYDVLEIIYQLACTDGGRTGCTLSLVSKSIRASSRASRFHSASLLSGLTAQLKRFHEAFDAARTQAQAERAPLPRLRHLCIRLTPACAGPLYLDQSTLEQAGFYHHLMLDERLPDSAYDALKKTACKDYHRAFRALLTAALADLESLCLLRSLPRRSVPAVPPIPCPSGFPRLRELAFNDAFPPFLPVAPKRARDGGGRRPATPPIYPALRRLHMAVSACAPVDFRFWARHAPHLAWLRVTTSHTDLDDDFCIVSSLARVLGDECTRAPDNPPSNPPAPSCSFSALQTLMLMIEPPPPSPSRHTTPAYAAFAAHTRSALSALRVPHPYLDAHYYGEDSVPPPGAGTTGAGAGTGTGTGRERDRERRWAQTGSRDEGMRRDWLLRAGGGAGLYARLQGETTRSAPPSVVGFWAWCWRAVCGEDGGVF